MSPDVQPASPFRLDFGAIDAGWIEATARLGATTIKTQASYLGEPLTDWITACLDLKNDAAYNYPTSAAPARKYVDWNNEPSVHRFILEISDASLAVKISCIWASDPPPGQWERHDEDCGWIVIPWADLAAETCRAARVVYRRYGLRRYGDAWIGGEFPAGRLLALHALRYGEGLFARFPTEHDLLSCEDISCP